MMEIKFAASLIALHTTTILIVADRMGLTDAAAVEAITLSLCRHLVRKVFENFITQLPR